MNLDPQHSASSEKTDSQADAASKGLSRRAALKLGAGAAPILMTLASRSAFACHSTTPSAFGSINASRPDVLKQLYGRDPEYWTDCTTWPSGCYKTKTKTQNATTLMGLLGSVCSPFTSTTTVYDILKLGPNCQGASAVARACITAHFNAMMGYTSSVLPTTSVRIMWQQYAATGHYTPTAGVTWYATTPSHPQVAGVGGIIGYLNTTWT